MKLWQKMIGLLVSAAIALVVGVSPAQATPTARVAPNDASGIVATAPRAGGGSAGATPNSDGTGKYVHYCSYPGPGTRLVTKPETCLGTLTTYISGNFVSKVNMLALASKYGGQRGVTMAMLDKWCGDHPFQCTVVVGLPSLFLGILALLK